MSTDDNLAAAAAASPEKFCASCGVAEIDDVELKPCPKCDLVVYCGDECEQGHREEHEAICKERAAEMYDELLFKQPESNHLGDCPICFLPMPLDSESVFAQVCCGKKLCIGCSHANSIREMNERLKEHRCPFCRHIQPKTKDEVKKLCIERAELNDPIALEELGSRNYHRGDYGEAFRYFTKGVSLGDAVAMYGLSLMYRDGKGGVEEDSDKERALLEKAAIAGHPLARWILGYHEQRNGRIDRAVLHWIIASNLGEELSIKTLKDCYKEGYVGKDDFAAALRAYQAAVDAMKSPQREVAKKYYDSVR